MAEMIAEEFYMIHVLVSPVLFFFFMLLFLFHFESFFSFTFF